MSEKEDAEQKVYECPNCGKQYLRSEQLNAHMRVHKHSLNQDELVEAIKSAVVEALKQAPTATPQIPASSATPPVTSATTTPPPARFGQFVIKVKPQSQTEDIFCPYCGTAELDRPLTVIEKERPVEKEVEVIPKGYIRAPRGGEDWLRVFDLKHSDGRSVDECPECAKTLLNWFNTHRSKLERASRGQ